MSKIVQFFRIGLIMGIVFIVVSCGRSDNQTAVRYRMPPQETKHARRTNAPIIVIDAGHGGFDMGATTTKLIEKDICLKTAHLVRKELEKLGYCVIMTRVHDEFISLEKRTKIASEMNGQVFVSIHYNSARNESARGIEVFYPSKSDSWMYKHSKDLAQAVLAKLISHTGAKSRGTKEGDYFVLKKAQIPSVIVEAGFLTNEEEERKILDSRYVDKIAQAVALGIDHYFQRRKL